jgi:hypothetical protein
MGFDPETIGRLSIWQYRMALDGYVKANTPDDGSLTKAEEDQLWAMVEAKSGRSVGVH